MQAEGGLQAWGGDGDGLASDQARSLSPIDPCVRLVLRFHSEPGRVALVGQGHNLQLQAFVDEGPVGVQCADQRETGGRLSIGLRVRETRRTRSSGSHPRCP